jgi:hypothetical protein
MTPLILCEIFLTIPGRHVKMVVLVENVIQLVSHVRMRRQNKLLAFSSLMGQLVTSAGQ